MRLIGTLRAAYHRRRFTPLEQLYSRELGPHEIREIQLRRFNEIWQGIHMTSSFYARLKSEYNLPNQFEDWQAFQTKVPTLERSTLRRETKNLRISAGGPDYWRVTGGTTSEPLQIPAWRREDRITGLDTWYARSWYGVEASDRLFLLWGHSHLLGEGLEGWYNAQRRRILDTCLGYMRHSAYDLSVEALRMAGRGLLQFRPDYLLGYSVALHRLAYANRDLRGRFRQLRLKVVIATGESFPCHDSVELISDVFGCPVVMEYGAVETGTIAHQLPDGGFHVFWGSNLVEVIPSPDWPGAFEILITTLYPRLVPLIRYRLGDLISGEAEDLGLPSRFGAVIGRCNDSISVGENGFVHSEAFSHVLRDIGEIQAFQVVQREKEDITVNYLSENPLSSDTLGQIRDRLSKVDNRLRSTSFERVERLAATTAGKTKRIVNETGHRLST